MQLKVKKVNRNLEPTGVAASGRKPQQDSAGSLRRSAKSPLPCAFSRLDLVVLIGLAGWLAGWLAISHTGERGRAVRCAGNLKALGQAMQEFANDHGNGLPTAGINLGKTKLSWDSLVMSYSGRNANSQAPQLYACPSDSLERKKGGPRSYAMAGNDMLPGNWPPGPESATGVGLYWDKDTVAALLPAEAATNLELLPELKLSAVPVPAATLLLTELIATDNVVGDIRQVRLFGISSQWQFVGGNGRFHRGRFNYLMVAGQVERRSPLQAGVGIWTLNQGD